MKKKYVYIAVLTALATVLSITESFVPMPMATYGAKPGLANVVTMTAMVLLSPWEALGIMFVRVVLSSLMTGAVTALPYGLVGGTMAWMVMTVLYKWVYPRVSFVGISICGAVFHSLAQVAVAVVITGTQQVFAYFPYLAIISTVTGFFTGLCTNFLLPFLDRKKEGNE